MVLLFLTTKVLLLHAKQQLIGDNTVVTLFLPQLPPLLVAAMHIYG